MRYLVFILLVVGACAKKRYDGHKLLTVFAKGKDDADFLNSLQSDSYHFEELDFWTGPSPVVPTDIRVSPNDFVQLRDLLMDAGIQFNISIDNLQIPIDIEEESLRAAQKRNIGLCDIYAQYCTYDQIYEVLADWYGKHADKMGINYIGTSYENNAIEMVRISSDYSVYKPAILVEVGTHSREWIGVSSGLVLIDTLLSGSSYGNAMLENFDWYIVPLHNPDGYKYTWTNDRYWRKNRMPCLGSGTGIDLNRNWDVNYAGGGSSSRCSDITYHGNEAFEAHETDALRAAFEDIQLVTEVFAFFSIHCYSQMMLLPYAYTNDLPQNYNELYNVALGMMNALQLVDGTYFQIGTPPQLLGAASGSAMDYFYEVGGVPYSYTYELRPGPNQGLAGFSLPVDQIIPATMELVQSLYYFATTMNPNMGKK